MRFVPAAVFLLGFGASAFAASSPRPGNVIFVTIDGVRFQEFFGGVRKPARAGRPLGTPLFPGLRESAASGEAWLFGDGAEGGAFRVGNLAALSLPGYRGILSGEFEDRCRKNDCANVDRDTIFDGLIDRGFAREDLAAFASWANLGRALERRPGRINRDVAHGTYPAEGASTEERAEAARIEAAERADLPSWGDRRDVYTYALGRLYLERRRPRFLYLSFLDSDEYGHRNEYRNYADSLLRYDAWISELRSALAAMGEYGENTSIVLTTDHGRGRGFLWSVHGAGVASAFRTWAAVIPSLRLRAEGIRPRLARNYTQLDLRPTLEDLLGVPMASDRRHPGRSLVSSAGN